MSYQPGFDFAQHFDPSEFIAEPQPPSPLQHELKRRHGNYERVLTRLQQGPCTNAELVEIAGHRFGGRIFELRKDGHVIQMEPMGDGLFRYTLKGKS